ncbi:MAG: hypothetical protein Q8K11_02010 [Phenylobacterium sp.]|uniref:hypothetical protein n=1 Tax=Phenylobacterium sp. TaxID=1871053 RepID=UPI0027314BB7|nr:hypothetical protein [Phenylobacterium sp.]MDP2008928.1 hypothetical protein [Phenylobacterium sp.]
MSQEQALAEAEAFIRKAVARTGGKLDDEAIKAAASKVVKALPPEAEKRAA